MLMDGIIGGPRSPVQKNLGKKSRVSGQGTLGSASLVPMNTSKNPDIPSPTSGNITRQLLAAEIVRVRMSLDHHTRALDALEDEAKPHRAALEEARRKLARLMEEEGRA